jgi:hypothetical protein
MTGKRSTCGEETRVKWWSGRESVGWTFSALDVDADWQVLHLAGRDAVQIHGRSRKRHTEWSMAGEWRSSHHHVSTIFADSKDIEAILHCIRFSSEGVPLGEEHSLPIVFGDQVLGTLAHRQQQGRGENRLRLTVISVIRWLFLLIAAQT